MNCGFNSTGTCIDCLSRETCTIKLFLEDIKELAKNHSWLEIKNKFKLKTE